MCLIRLNQFIGHLRMLRGNSDSSKHKFLTEQCFVGVQPIEVTGGWKSCFQGYEVFVFDDFHCQRVPNDAVMEVV